MIARVSVIICTYNYARFLQRCLESVHSQSRPPDEVIVVDDGSTDETREVVSRFPSVRYRFQPNAGKAAAFNLGFASASGEILCHLDADDYWLPNKVERCLELLEQTPAGGVMHDAYYADGAGSPLYGSEQSPGMGGPPWHLSFRKVLLASFIYPLPRIGPKRLGVANTICVRRAAVSDCFPLPAELGLAVDGALLLGAARHGLIVSPDKLSAYRHHDSNYYVRDANSRQFQRLLFQWASQLVGVEEPYDKSVLHMLAMESSVHAALAIDRKPLESTVRAAFLVPGLLRLGLLPNWKHMALPAACLLRWPKMRNLLSGVHAAWQSRRHRSPAVAN